jgi:hypothetical protein
MTVDPQPPVIRAAEVPIGPEQAFTIFTDEIGAWWPYHTHGVFADRAGGVRFRDGCLVELAIDGDEVTWAEVTSWEPPKGFVLDWHPGRPSDGPASRVEVSFEPLDGGAATKVEIRHDRWEAFGEDGMSVRRSYAGPSAWGSLLDHFSDCVEPQVDQVSLTGLAEAYDQFFTEALDGLSAAAYGPPEEGHWTAEQVVAHVALNDLAMVSVAQKLIHGNEPLFENQTCQVPANLQRVTDRHPDPADLVAFGRSCAAQAMAAVSRLNADQQATMVHCRLEHEGNQVLDEPRPWAVLAVEVQSGMHLPAHIGQLRDLR